MCVMRPIQMVDLKGQYAKIREKVDGAIREVIESTAFINGKAVTDFAKNLSSYLGISQVIPCANGTDALQIALMGLDLKPGDEVITPSFTFIATTEVVALLGLKPLFADVDPATFCLDPANDIPEPAGKAQEAYDELALHMQRLVRMRLGELLIGAPA